jgi:hypothetical protein
VPFQNEDLWGAHSSAAPGGIQSYLKPWTEFCCGISTRVLNFLWTLNLFKTFGSESVEAQPVVPEASSGAPFNRRPVSRCIGSRSRMHSLGGFCVQRAMCNSQIYKSTFTRSAIL